MYLRNLITEDDKDSITDYATLIELIKTYIRRDKNIAEAIKAILQLFLDPQCPQLNEIGQQLAKPEIETTLQSQSRIQAARCEFVGLTPNDTPLSSEFVEIICMENYHGNESDQAQQNMRSEMVTAARHGFPDSHDHNNDTEPDDQENSHEVEVPVKSKEVHSKENSGVTLISLKTMKRH